VDAPLCQRVLVNLADNDREGPMRREERKQEKGADTLICDRVFSANHLDDISRYEKRHNGAVNGQRSE
jgi:hypothetical protein